MTDTKNTEVVTLTNKEELQLKLKKALKTVDKKIASLNGNANLTSFKTTGQFKYNELDGNVVNILTHTDVVYLIKALALMIRIKKEYQEAAETSGLTSYPICSWFGVPVDNWIHDLTLRVKLVGNANLINQLSTERKKLEAFLSEDQRLETTLSNLSELLK